MATPDLRAPIPMPGRPIAILVGAHVEDSRACTVVAGPRDLNLHAPVFAIRVAWILLDGEAVEPRELARRVVRMPRPRDLRRNDPPPVMAARVSSGPEWR